MARQCASGFGAPGDPAAAARDAELAHALTWLTEAGIFTQAVQMGEMVPDFTVPDCHGGTIELQGLLDRGPLVLLFALSLDIADVCRALTQLQEALPTIEATGAHLVVLSAALPAAARATSEALHIAFPIGHDAGNHVAQLFGLTYQPPEPSDRWCLRLGLPPAALPPDHLFVLPATYIIDSDGVAEYAVLEADLRHRVRIADLLRALSPLNSRR